MFRNMRPPQCLLLRSMCCALSSALQSWAVPLLATQRALVLQHHASKLLSGFHSHFPKVPCRQAVVTQQLSRVA